jgi:UDP-N-acetyl-D-glucosamine dehydrogenase
MSSLQQKIVNRKANIAVIGLGYVGLPLAVNFAKAGYKVYGLDTDQDRVNKVNRCESYILDIPQRELAAVVKNQKFEARTQFDVLKIVDCVIVCVPTPLKRKYTPDISYIVSALKTITKYIKKGTLVVLESTTYPGTTEELMLPVLEKEGLKLDQDFFLSFSPERIDPGNKNYDVTRIPKLVGGVSAQSGVLTKMLYEKIIKNVHLVSSSKAAEMAKLLENSFRIINIGWINEVAMMCHKMGIDVWEVIDAAKTKPFGFMAFYPGLGVGGHCIPDDPLYLYWKAKHHGFSSKYIKLSADTNLFMPRYAVDRLKEAFQKKKKVLKSSRILVVGVTYKKDVKDLRKSPPLKLIHILQTEKCGVDYYDPIIPYLNIEGIHMNSIALTAHNLKKYDAVLIATDHTNVSYELILKNSKFIFDIRNVYKGKHNPKIVKL